MKCPDCSTQAKCVDTRERKKDGARRRIYNCVSCAKNFTTLEHLVVRQGMGRPVIERTGLSLAQVKARIDGLFDEMKDVEALLAEELGL